MVRYIENVPYYRFHVRYTLANGKRRRMTRWSPGFPWVRDEIARELVERFSLDGIKPGSVTIESAEPQAPVGPERVSQWLDGINQAIDESCAFHDAGNAGPCNRCEP
jgi:hypothetical protein